MDTTSFLGRVSATIVLIVIIISGLIGGHYFLREDGRLPQPTPLLKHLLYCFLLSACYCAVIYSGIAIAKMWRKE